MSRFAVVVCGGGIAGTEGLLRLRRLAGDNIDLTLLCPEEWLAYRPLAVRQPFGLVPTPRYPIKRIADDTNARWVQDALAWVDLPHQSVHTPTGETLRYDALLLAVGGRKSRASWPGVDVFDDRNPQGMRDIVSAMDTGLLKTIAFLQPEGPAWPLPLYELALLTAKQARTSHWRPDISLITPEPRLLYPFGGPAADAMASLLQEADITVHTSSPVRVSGQGQLVLEPTGTVLRADRIVTVPAISGPNVRGIPGDAMDRFLETDSHCRVLNTDGRIFAAGDATALPVKHGGIGAQQADTASAAITHLAGLGDSPPALHPVIRGMLLTGDRPLYLSAHLIAGQGWRAELYEQPPWPLDDKVIAEELGPYLRSLEPIAAS